MQLKKLVLSAVLVGGSFVAATAHGQKASDADRAFVAKVSQGGMYEVEAGRVAAMRGTTPAVKDFALLEVHDHEGVGAGLKRVASATGVSFAPRLNAEFAARLAKLKSVSSVHFDAYYVADMKQIHDNDEGLFSQEAKDGSPAYREFAHNTAVLVAAHLGWLNTL
jgi:putative membrane protein